MRYLKKSEKNSILKKNGGRGIGIFSLFAFYDKIVILVIY